MFRALILISLLAAFLSANAAQAVQGGGGYSSGALPGVPDGAGGRRARYAGSAIPGYVHAVWNFRTER
jgi:hypothetical protein